MTKKKATKNSFGFAEVSVFFVCFIFLGIPLIYILTQDTTLHYNNPSDCKTPFKANMSSQEMAVNVAKSPNCWGFGGGNDFL